MHALEDNNREDFLWQWIFREEILDEGKGDAMRVFKHRLIINYRHPVHRFMHRRLQTKTVHTFRLDFRCIAHLHNGATILPRLVRPVVPENKINHRDLKG
ncbi:hypothetical protein M569_11540 [Genlisea aurea]|uniref:Uncharacterized protein n=1 Tax=Genlisea aurea TaxID=192259 RepID=S8CFC4_9LAMI|nr:hypothetical protein M569_11540 [Genlisea aurea]